MSIRFVTQSGDPDVHHRHTTRMRAEVDEQLARHVKAAHTLRTEGDTANLTKLRAIEDTHSDAFLKLAAALDGLRRLDAARDYIRTNAHTVPLSGEAQR